MFNRITAGSKVSGLLRLETIGFKFLAEFGGFAAREEARHRAASIHYIRFHLLALAIDDC